VGEDGEYTYFEATSPKFSMYAVSANSEVKPPYLVAMLVAGVAASIGGYFMMRRRSTSASKRKEPK
jgi:hypothetical protein